MDIDRLYGEANRLSRLADELRALRARVAAVELGDAVWAGPEASAARAQLSSDAEQLDSVASDLIAVAERVRREADIQRSASW
jgi:hypothetical protein